MSHAERVLCEACKAGDLKGVRQALDDGADVDARDEDGFTPLMLAAEIGKGEIVEALLAAGASINATTAKGSTALSLACDFHEKGRGDRLTLAEEMPACRKRHLECVRLLLDRGADPNIRNSASGTAISGTLKPDAIDFLRLLLAKGANPNHQLHDGSTALMRVSWEGNYEACEALLAAGAKVDLVANNGWDAILSAKKQGHDRIAELLRAKA